MKKVGLIVNPIAGMGGTVGLKGTDGGIYKEAIKRGAKPITPQRVGETLSEVKHKELIYLFVAPNNMGADYIKSMGFNFEILGEISDITNSDDTKRIAKEMIEKSIELLIFCGGDGTARDIFDAIGLQIPVVAIPAGVKMYSSVFTLNPRAAARVIDKFIEEKMETQDKEVLDIDEDLIRKDVLDARLYGYLKVPKVFNLIQSGKAGSSTGKTIEENKLEIAQFIIENMENDTLYLLGPGTTIKAITDNLSLPKTLLGIDGIYQRKIIGFDLNEKGILELLNNYEKVEIIISPIGGNGFIFGRGSLQFTPKIINKIGKEKIKIIATSEKMRELSCLRVDTGDVELDTIFKGFAKVIIGYKEELIVSIEC